MIILTYNIAKYHLIHYLYLYPVPALNLSIPEYYSGYEPFRCVTDGVFVNLRFTYVVFPEFP